MSSVYLQIQRRKKGESQYLMEEGGRLRRGYGKYIQRRDERHPGVLGPISLLRGRTAFLLLDSVTGCLEGRSEVANWVVVVFSQSLSRVQLFTTPWTAAHQAFHHHLPAFALTHVFWVGDAIQPSHPLSLPSPPAFNLSQHQSLFQWVNS